jgi:hypothetical protein
MFPHFAMYAMEYATQNPTQFGLKRHPVNNPPNPDMATAFLINI